jgi:hypothetical protein
MLWHGMKQGGISAYQFLQWLTRALNDLEPRCIVLFDGHGGLDELSIAAALVSDVTLIINEPDLITFTGSITLYHEISRSCEQLDLEPLIQFIVNRVPPNKTIWSMERDFGDVLHTVSAAPEPVVAYFPLERELFGVFGDDPFVSEIFTEFWFSQKVRMLARYLEAHGAARGRLGAAAATRSASAVRTDERIRTALRRKLHMRGDKLLMLWLGLAVVALWILYTRALNAAFSESRTLFGATGGGWDWSAIVVGSAGLYLTTQTWRWFAVQWRHLRNARSVRLRHGRWRRLGESASAPLLQQVETVAERRRLLGGLRGAAIAIVGGVAVIAALIVPNLRDALVKAKETRTVADIRNTGTAMFSWLTDQVGAAATGAAMTEYDVTVDPLISVGDLSTVLVPQYIQSVQVSDGWMHPYEYRLNVKDPSAKQVMAIRSPGRDGRFEGNIYTVTGFEATDYDQDIVWADGFFVRAPAKRVP